MANNRNKPCQCGSGKKHKKCCYQSDSYRLASSDKMKQILKDQQGEPKQYFGYNNDLSNAVSPIDLPEEGMLCMVSEVVEKDVDTLNSETGGNFKVDDWFVSAMSDRHEYKVFGPFESEANALAFGEQELGVVKYRGAPVFDMVM